MTPSNPKGFGSTQTLDIQTALNYAIKHLNDLGYTIAIVSSKPSTEYGIEVVDIIFTIQNEDGLGGEVMGNRHTFSVWLEDGEIHGEW